MKIMKKVSEMLDTIAAGLVLFTIYNLLNK